MDPSFLKEMQNAYRAEEVSALLGSALFSGECLSNIPVNISIKMFNRHGLITGATGTGKTKTIQTVAERLSSNGVPVLLMDIKGDLSGLAKPGIDNPKIEERQKKMGIPYEPKKFPVELLTLSGESGVKLRATVSEFGPLLMSKILNLTDTQNQLMSVVFQYCDEEKLPLVDLTDLKAVLKEMTSQEIQNKYGYIPKNSVSAIVRKIIALEQQGVQKIFGEPSFQAQDLIRFDERGEGYISIMQLSNIQDKPLLFSTFMLELLAEIFSSFPEVGDLPKPKLVMFIDEAHLIFENASKALIDQIETTIRLIRSKGVGIFFCTQSPKDIPQNILGQLGLKVQHALRAFTAKDRKEIKLAAENFPLSNYYKTSELITQLGTGEALITALDEKGIPTPLICALIRAPSSFMGTLKEEEIKTINDHSHLVQKYAKTTDRISAHEILKDKIVVAQDKWKKEKSTLETILKSTTVKQIGRTVAKEFTRSILGVLGLGGKRK